MAQQRQTWRQWALSIPANSRRAITKSWNAAAWSPCKSASQVLKRWMKKNRRPLVAYNRSPSDCAPPIRLPKSRKRALSIRAERKPTLLGCVTPGKEVQVTYSQEQSQFIAKLPPELRMIIYRFVLGNRVLHIIPSLVPSRTPPPTRSKSLMSLKLPPVFLSRLDYEPCKWSRDLPSSARLLSQHPHSACATWINREGELYFNAPCVRNVEDIETRFLRWWSRKSRVLSLVKTCRLIYSEAIPILYSTNTFDFRSLQTLSQFPTTILPKRLNSIRSVHLRFTLSNPSEMVTDKNWAEICRILKTLNGLREVCLIVENDKGATEKAMERLLGDLTNLKMDGNFAVRTLPHPLD